MIDDKKIIVSLTSWKKRIQYVSKTIYMMETQTIKPDLIVLNLAEDEFPNKEKDLPAELVLFSTTLDNFEIYWVKENTKAFKKVIPTIKRFFNEDCWIFSIDEDVLYYKDYLKCFLEELSGLSDTYLSPGIWGNHPVGYIMAYNPKWFKDEKIWKFTKIDADKIVASDHWIWINLKNNGIKLKISKKIHNQVKLLNRGNALGGTYRTIPFNTREKYIINRLEEIK